VFEPGHGEECPSDRRIGTRRTTNVNDRREELRGIAVDRKVPVGFRMWLGGQVNGGRLAAAEPQRRRVAPLTPAPLPRVERGDEEWTRRVHSGLRVKKVRAMGGDGSTDVDAGCGAGGGCKWRGSGIRAGIRLERRGFFERVRGGCGGMRSAEFGTRSADLRAPSPPAPLPRGERGGRESRSTSTPMWPKWNENRRRKDASRAFRRIHAYSRSARGSAIRLEVARSWNDGEGEL
jgi:hypothetical protein